ncbi:MAG: CHAT domain-containing protein, partial [Saprospiraceae bacterium]|nr:CHAT domain-containing protein [Saprospiraceae bacterium]
GFLLSIASGIGKLAASDTAAARLNDLVKSYRRRLAAQLALPIPLRKDVEGLEQRANAAEKELARSVAGFGDVLRQVHWQDVQAALRPGEAAVEFVHFQYFRGLRATDSVLYAALVLRPEDNFPRLVPLFEARQLARLLPENNDMDRIDAFYKAPVGLAVYNLVWKPLAALLKSSKTVYCSPSGLLHRLNLGAIPVSSRQIIADRHNLVLLGSTRQLATSGDKGKSRGEVRNAALFGGIYYDLDSTIAAPVPTVDLQRGSEPGSGVPRIEIPALPGMVYLPVFAPTPWGPRPWKYLPSTAFEVFHIDSLLRANGYTTRIFTGADAAEEAFQKIERGSWPASPRIVHLATHGYFYPDVSKGQPINPLTLDGDVSVFQVSEEPMIRSGLILAGANQTWTTGLPPAGRADGILTAYEISQLDLSNTELVVLSACETGLGVIDGNVGVYGLQRAFNIAGARYLIMSLWQVNDRKTGELMEVFYRAYLVDGLSVPQAFRAAQQTMRARFPGSPYVWAGFVLVE